MDSMLSNSSRQRKVFARLQLSVVTCFNNFIFLVWFVVDLLSDNCHQFFSWYRLLFMNDSTTECSTALMNNAIDHISPSRLPLTLQFIPGVKAVQGTTLEMGTLGNFTFCFQALSQDKVCIF